MSEKEITFHTVEVEGTSINFPFKPYDLQIEYMKKVLECVRDGRNGLLESPTGTGKTLSLLCSSLAWLQEAKASSQLARLKAANAENVSPTEWISMGGGQQHKIIYSSRTHSQLSQAMSELAGTTYRYNKVAILGSRDQLCVNPAVMQASNSREKLHMCQARVKSKSCSFHQNVEKNRDRAELKENKIMDIEDLHKLGKKHNFCPYYMSREIYQTADVIFLPYNYLLDAKTRKTLDLDLAGSVIIFDEAHNIQKLCEEAASVSISLSDIALAVQDIASLSEELNEPSVGAGGGGGRFEGLADVNESELLAIKGFLLDIETHLTGLMQSTKSLTKAGTYIAELFGQFANARVKNTLDMLVDYASSSGAEGGMSRRGRGLTKVADLATVAFNENVKQEDLETVYKVHILKEEKSDVGRGFLKTKSESVTLNLWCFSPGFSMQSLAKLGARSIILTSGTLSPLSAFQEEIGIPFPVQLENKHIISASQVWCGVVTAGPDGTMLNSSFKCRSDPKYLNSLGQSVINIIRVVPHGVLLFFPSYSMMNSTREFWQGNGLWSRIEGIKPIFLEPQKKDALSATMKDYYAAAKTRTGACFMAVCRGKVAEGLDFADDNGRAVIITGLPYPPLKDARVELKRQFLDDELKKNGRNAGGGGGQGMTGSKWYSLEAFRATNQAVGRVIRHSRDHGAIIFLDSRFKDQNARQALSTWLQPFFQAHNQAGTAIRGIAGFFKTDSMIGKQRGEIIAEHTALIAKNKGGVKRQRVEVELEDTAPPAIDFNQYKDGGPALDEAACSQQATSIFSTSSQSRITFGSTATPGDASAAVFKVPRAPITSGVQPKKRLKIAVRGLPTNPGGTQVPPTSPSPSASSQSPTPSRPSQRIIVRRPVLKPKKPVSNRPPAPAGSTEEKARNYIASLKKTICRNEFILFKNSIKCYKEDGDLKVVKSALDTIMVKYLKYHPELLTGFKAFLRAEHYEEFDRFCALTMTMMDEVVQIGGPIISDSS